MAPANDNLANAQLLTTNGSISGTTVDSTVEVGKETNDGYVNTVWYRIEVAGTGDLTITFTAESYGLYAELYSAVGSRNNTPMSSDPPADFADLVKSYSNYETYWDSVGGSPVLTRTLSVVAGDVYYLLVTSDSFIEGDWGTFSFDIAFPLIYTCLNAIDYINVSSATATIVSGNVRETQTWDGDVADPYESIIGDMVPTLTIPGADIGDAGFYVVKATTKNIGGGSIELGFSRNGQPLLTQAILTQSTASSVFHEDWITRPYPTYTRRDSLQMLWYLPSKPGDTIDVYVFGTTNGGSITIDIQKLCFSKILSASDGPAYDMLDVPDYPLGTTHADMTTRDVLGQLAIYRNSAPTYNRFQPDGADMCVTDDGTVWAAAMLQTGGSFGIGAPYIGPYLMSWNGSSWTIVNDDIEGLGVKRSTRGGVSGSTGPYSLSIDTDGTDIWICYGVADAVGPQGGYNFSIRVRKYDVGGASWSDVGSLVKGNTTRTLRNGIAGGFEQTPIIKLSPGGVPWLAFTDIYDSPLQGGGAIFPYVTKFNGSDWDTPTRLPAPQWYEDDSYTIYQAKDYRFASGTTSETTFSGEDSVQETQTTYAADTIRLTPPAGDWGFRLKLAVAPTGGGYKAKFYKNGSAITSATDDLAGGSFSAAWFGGLDQNNSGMGPVFWSHFNGTDELEIRLARTGTATDVHIDEIIQVPVAMIPGGATWFTSYVDDSQAQVDICFPNSENPVAVYMTETIDTATIPSDKWLNGDGTYYFVFIYSKFNGSTWDKKWEHIVEDDVPDHVNVHSRDHPSWKALGHWQQGLSLFAHGTDVYMQALVGVQHAADTNLFVNLTDSGMVPFSAVSPSVLMGGGYPGLTDSTYMDGWDGVGHHRAIFVDNRANRWVGYVGEGPSAEGLDIIGVNVPNGIGDWFLASSSNLEIGFDKLYVVGALAMSPDQTKLYYMITTDIYNEFTYFPTFGVWECSVLQDEKIPLIVFRGGNIDLTRIKFRGYQAGDA